MKSNNTRKKMAVYELIKAYNELQQNDGATHEELEAIALAIDTLIVAYDLNDSFIKEFDKRWNKK